MQTGLHAGHQEKKRRKSNQVFFICFGLLASNVQNVCVCLYASVCASGHVCREASFCDLGNVLKAPLD